MHYATHDEYRATSNNQHLNKMTSTANIIPNPETIPNTNTNPIPNLKPYIWLSINTMLTAPAPNI